MNKSFTLMVVAPPSHTQQIIRYLNRLGGIIDGHSVEGKNTVFVFRFDGEVFLKAFETLLEKNHPQEVVFHPLNTF